MRFSSLILSATALSWAAEAKKKTPVQKKSVEVRQDRIKSVQRISFLKKGRFELTPLFAVSLNDAFYQKMGGGASAAFHIADSLALRQDDGGGWKPRILKCSARDGVGVDELISAMGEHHALLKGNGLLEQRRLDHIRDKVRRLVNDRLRDAAWTRFQLDQRLAAIEVGAVSPYRLAETLLKDLNLWKDGS